MFRVVKRDGDVNDFTMNKISDAIIKAFNATDVQFTNDIVDLLTLRVIADFQPKVKDGSVHVEDIQDSVEKTLEHAAEVVSKLLNLPAVLNVSSTDVIEQIKILKISEKVLLIILMSKAGTVKDVVVQITDTLPEERIDELSTLLNKSLKGTPLENLPYVLNEIVHKELKRYSSVLTEINKNMVQRIAETKSSVKGDISGLLALPEFSEIEEVKKFLNVVGTKDIIKEVLDKIEANDVSVIIGSEHKEMLLKDYTLISLDMTDDTTNASIGVIAPKRVDYSKTISTIKLVNEKLRKLFNKD